MSLRTLVWLAAISYTLVIGGSLLLYRLLVVYPTIEETALELRQNNITALAAVYENDRENFTLFNLDWAKWDNTFQYVNGQLPSYPQYNILSPSFLETETDAVIIINMQGQLIYATQKFEKAFKETRNINDITQDLDIQNILGQDNQTGLIRHNEFLGYFVSHLIQDTEKRQPANGALIFIRDFNQRFFKRLNISNGVHFELTPLKHSETSNEPMVESFTISKLKNNYIFGLGNNQGKVIAHAQFTYPANSTPKALDSTTLFSITSLLTLPLFITVIIYFMLLRPIIEISIHINRMKKTGEVYHLRQKNHITEIDGFLNRFNILVDKIHSYQKKLLDDSNTDGLTQIYNRKYFDEAFDSAWRSSARNSSNLYIIMIDIDYFKKYNDHYGHQQGDEALKKVAKALHDLTRRAEDTLARYGGEEFVIICHCSGEAQLNTKLESILQSVRDLNIEHIESSISTTLSISCGTCSIANTGLWMKGLKDSALKMADDALYEAKNNGRDQYCIYAFNPSETKS
jgi:diguanylate cyclase (GGDEF)-like protein